MPWRPSRAEGGDDPHPIGVSLDRLVRRFGPGASAATVIFSRWEDIVGVQVAAHCRPLSVSGETLVVGVDAPGWATQLRFLAADLLRRVAELAGPDLITAVDIRVRP